MRTFAVVAIIVVGLPLGVALGRYGSVQPCDMLAMESVRLRAKSYGSGDAPGLATIGALRMVLLGLPNPEIAAKLRVSQSTVKSHLHHIYEKLDIDSRIGLLLFVQREGLKWAPGAFSL